VVTEQAKYADRRQFLRRGLWSALIAVVAPRIRPASAQDFPKISKADAGYLERDQPVDHMCAECVFFIRPDACKFVQGPISELGWCIYYSD
jgi:hypothetical protein